MRIVCLGNSMMDKDAIQLEELLLIASYYSHSNCDKPPVPYADFTFTLWTSLLITIIWGSCNSFQEMDSSPVLQFVSNPHLKLLDDDVLFHIGIKAGDQQKLRNLFGDVKVSFLVTTFFSITCEFCSSNKFMLCCHQSL